MNSNEKKNLQRALAEEDRFRERQTLLRQLWKAEQAEEAAAKAKPTVRDRKVVSSNP